MSDPILIGLVGKQGAGKSSLKRELVERLPRSVHDRFAGTIYAMHDAMLEVAQIQGIPTRKKDRELLQYLGTTWGREGIHENVWVNALLRRFADISHYGLSHMIVDDVRFPNEADAIEGVGGILIKIDTPEEVRKERIGDTWGDPTHISETALDGRDNYTVTVDGRLHPRDNAEYIISVVRDTHG